MDRTSAILACGVTFLICGAICVQTLKHLEHGGVTVVPWLTGTQQDVLDAFRDDTLTSLSMPGCHSPNAERRGCPGKENYPPLRFDIFPAMVISQEPPGPCLAAERIQAPTKAAQHRHFFRRIL